MSKFASNLPPSEWEYCVSFSGGLGSYEAWRRMREKHGDKAGAVFSDVGSVFEGGVCVSGEDEDLFRFMRDVEKLLEDRVVVVRSPDFENLWDLAWKRKFIPNRVRDGCSDFLKRQVLDKWIRMNCPQAKRVVGYGWLEQSRVDGFLEYFPDSVFPLLEPPYLINEEICDQLRAAGVQPPRAYEQGFSHNNCGGFCVKMGVGQLYQLWRIRPDRYEYNERREREFVKEFQGRYIGARITIFYINGKPCTMEELRERFEAGYVPRTANIKEGCGGTCMIPLPEESE